MKTERAKFMRWLHSNGAETLMPRGESEFARFKARDVLCIVHQDGARNPRRGNHDLATEIYKTFSEGGARARMDLSNTPIDEHGDQNPATPREVWAAGTAIVERVRRGEEVSIKAEARALRVPVDRMARIVAVRGLEVHGGAIVAKGHGQQLSLNKRTG